MSATWAIVTLISFVGDVLLLIGLPGIAARQAPEAGGLGLAGVVLTFLGGLLFTSFTIVGLAIFPWLAKAAPNLTAGDGPASLFVYFIVASIVFGLGGVFLGITIMRTGVLPYSAGLLLVIGTVLNVVAFPLTGVLNAVVSAVAYAFFASGLGWMGYALIQGHRGQATMA